MTGRPIAWLPYAFFDELTFEADGRFSGVWSGQIDAHVDEFERVEVTVRDWHGLTSPGAIAVIESPPILGRDALCDPEFGLSLCDIASACLDLDGDGIYRCVANQPPNS